LRYFNVVPAIFIERPNRFLAKVLIDNKIEMVHVRNSGRCKEILIPGTRVYLEKIHNNKKRKTSYSIISAYKGLQLINIDSQIPNELVSNAIRENTLAGIDVGQNIKREVNYNNSRFDLMYSNNSSKGFIEVKGVTLEKNKIALFPDAPTKRGKKHIDELIASAQKDYKNYLVFIIQMKGVDCFKPNDDMDLEFGVSLRKANAMHIKIRVYDCLVTEDSIRIDKPVKLLL
jgi:sugar fermentation stimulation protein A